MAGIVVEYKGRDMLGFSNMPGRHADDDVYEYNGVGFITKTI